MMKRRTVKKRMRQEEKHVADTLMLYLQLLNSTEKTLQDEKCSYLGFSLAYLLMSRLALDHPQWPYRERWIDNIEWETREVNQPGKFRGTGKLWWGRRNDVGGGMTQAPIRVELNVLKG